MVKDSVEAKGGTRIVNQLSSCGLLTSLGELASIWVHIEDSSFKAKTRRCGLREGTKVSTRVSDGCMFMITRKCDLMW